MTVPASVEVRERDAVGRVGSNGHGEGRGQRAGADRGSCLVAKG
jgi:hypothetical protein